MPRAKLLRGQFNTRSRVYKPGDIISDVSFVPKDFRDQWEILPDKVKKTLPAKPVLKTTSKRRKAAPKKTTPKKESQTVSKKEDSEDSE